MNNGLIGEAKAFANEKPDSLFHAYIEEFLKMKEIRGIVGGGYMPENNSILRSFKNQPECVSGKNRILDSIRSGRGEFDMYRIIKNGDISV